MEASVPPRIEPPRNAKVSFVKTLVIIFCVGIFGIIFLSLILMITGTYVGGTMMGSMMNNIINPVDLKPSSGSYQVKIIEVNAQSNTFSERLSVRCFGDMKACIRVVDLKQTGIYEASGPSGEIIYYEGDPNEIGESASIHSSGGYSTVEIFFHVTTTKTNVIWHSSMAGETYETTIPDTLFVGNIQTNWPGPYQRSAQIPLANLGNLKILLTVK